MAKATRKHCSVWTERGELPARVEKRVFRAPAGAPVVGDWVAVSPAKPGEVEARVVAVLSRYGSLSRRAAGRAGGVQVVVANVDTAFVMMGLDGDFNPRRLERYLAIAWQGQVTPVVLLNKRDLHGAPDDIADEVRRIAPGAPVFAISAKHGHGLDALAPYLAPAHTVVVLGSSGVGKSTLVNRFLGEDRMRTEVVRARDDRGRHTTSHRELIPLASGALLIDTPGMRELGLFDHHDGIAEAFADVSEVAARCRFTDCAHEGEPGCAVRAAIEDGVLDATRVGSYLKLSSEVDTASVRRKQRERALLQRAYTKSRRKQR